MGVQIYFYSSQTAGYLNNAIMHSYIIATLQYDYQEALHVLEYPDPSLDFTIYTCMVCVARPLFKLCYFHCM